MKGKSINLFNIPLSLYSQELYVIVILIIYIHHVRVFWRYKLRVDNVEKKPVCLIVVLVQASYYLLCHLVITVALWLIRESAFLFHQCPDNALAPQPFYLLDARFIRRKNYSLNGNYSRSSRTPFDSTLPHLPVDDLKNKVEECERFSRALLESNCPCSIKFCFVTFSSFPFSRRGYII